MSSGASPSEYASGRPWTGARKKLRGGVMREYIGRAKDKWSLPPSRARRHRGHHPGDQPRDRAEPDSHQPADLARRPRAPHGHAARRRQPHRQRVDRRRRRCSRAPPARPGAGASRPSSTSTRGSAASWPSTSGRRRTFMLVTDLVGRQLAERHQLPTERDPRRFVAGLVKRVKAILVEHKDLGRCEGVGVVVPGMVDASVDRPRAARADPGLARPRACAIRSPPDSAAGRRSRTPARPARWRSCGRRAATRRPSERFGLRHGVRWPRRRLGPRRRGVRGRHNIAGEFGHVPLNIDGPRCGCGANGMLGGVRLEPRDAVALLRA